MPSADSAPVPVPDPAVPRADRADARGGPGPSAISPGGVRAAGVTGGHGYGEWELAAPDLPALRTAWRRLVGRHDALRAGPGPAAGRPARPPAPAIPITDLRGLDRGTCDERALAIRASMARPARPGRPDLPCDLRVTLLPGGRARLHWWFDAQAVDPWSWWHVAVPEFTRLYLGGEPARPARPVPPAPPPRSSGGQPGDRPAPPPDWPRAPRRPDGPPAPPQEREHILPSAALAAVARAARAAAVDVDAMLTALFAEVVRKWSGSDEFVLGVRVFGLAGQPAVAAVGNFARAGVLPAGDGGGRFRQRLRTVADRLDALRARPEGLAPAGGPPDLPVMLTSLVGSGREAARPGPGALLHWGLGLPGDVVHLQLLEAAGELRCRWDWPGGQYPAGMLDDIAAAFADLLQRVATDGAALDAGYFPLVPAAALRQREQVNATAAPVPDRLLQTYASEHAARRPDDIAIVTSSRQLTYGELTSRANQVGRSLRDLDVRPNSPVAVVMAKGWEQIVAAHGVLVAGGAYMPIDPAVPADRLQRLLEHGRVRIVLSQRGQRLAGPLPAGVLRLDVDRDFDAAPAAPLAPVQQPTDLAFIISTSGSTGTPKSIMLDHRAAVNVIGYANRRLGIGPQDRCLAVAGLNFDISAYDVFGLFAAGGRVVMPDPGPGPDPAHWAGLIEQAGVTFLNIVPALLEMLILAWETGRPRRSAAALRNVVVSGEAVPLALPGRLRAICPDVALVNGGGPAETCIWSIMYPISQVGTDWLSIPYGKPVANQRYHILDQRHRPRPVWVPGEMYVASDVGLARGYLNDPAQTAERFISLPGLAERAHSTGDLGRYLPDGNIEILGRADFQVKIQGVRIELGEIEATILAYAGAGAAAVVCDARQTLLAYVTRAAGDLAEPGDRDWVSGLRDYIARKLPAAMIPVTITVLDALPRTANGKIDRTALTSSAAAGFRGTTETVQPEIQRMLTGLWQEVLEAGEVGEDDNFFDLGGHSLALIRLWNRIYETFGLEADLFQLRSEPTLTAMAGCIADGLTGDLAGDAPFDADEVAMVPEDELRALLGDQ
jgi:amino acid adenylation domain-containing protein